MTDREVAWEAIHEALPACWLVGPALYSPERHGWLVSTHGPHPGRGKVPQTVTGEGDDELAALRDLDDQLRGVPKPDGSRMDVLRRRLRLAYFGGAEEWSRGVRDRGLTGDELGRVLGRYPGDIG